MLDDSFVVQNLSSDDRAETQESPPSSSSSLSRENVPLEEEEEKAEKTDHHIPAPVEQEQGYPAFRSHGRFTLQMTPSSDDNDYDSIMEFDNEGHCFSFGLNVSCGTTSANSTVAGDAPERMEKESEEKVHVDEDNENPRNEVTILKAILDHYSKNGTYPFSEFIAFHALIKSSLDVDVSASQLMKDIEGLKGKFDKIVGDDQKGLNLNFSRTSDQEVFELAKKIWGSESANVDDQSID